MNDIADSVYRPLVALTLASMLSTLPVRAKLAPLKVAGFSGGACQIKPTAYESSTSGATNFQDAQLPVAMPLS